MPPCVQRGRPRALYDKDAIGGERTVASAPMVLMLSLFYLRAVSGHPLGSRDEPVPSAFDPNTRSLYSIVSSCLFTVFACTWVSAHPNVPPPNQGMLARFWHRFSLMLVALIAPELMVGFAARQFLDARWFSKEYGVSVTHGFFFAMGGFVSKAGHHPIVTSKQLRLRPEYLTAIRSITPDEIEDKSKGDSVSKGLALLQGVWFITQCLARVQQHLPLTGLEVATLAFQVVSIVIWLLWWHKPLDVQQPILLESADEYVVWAERRHRRPETLIGPIRLFFSAVLGDCPDFDPASFHSVPSFWSTLSRNGLRFLVPAVIQFFVGTIFGIIHYSAGNMDFPSADEMLLWRCSSLLVASVPFALGFPSSLLVLGSTVLRRLGDSWTKIRSLVEAFLGGIFLILAVFTIPAYIAARLILITLSFTTLRALPPGALVDVSWTTYIPHL